MQATVGSTVKLRRRRPDGTVLVVEAPDGSVFQLSVDRGTYDLWVPQVGMWRFSWDTEPEYRTIDVIELAQQAVEKPEEPVEPYDLLSGGEMPPASLTRRPRY